MLVKLCVPATSDEGEADIHAIWDLQAKKRQLIDQRLQAKLRKETDASRRADDAKKDKTAANRKEEELQLRDSIVRPTSLPVPFYIWPLRLPILLFFHIFVILMSHIHLAQTAQNAPPAAHELPAYIRQYTHR